LETPITTELIVTAPQNPIVAYRPIKDINKQENHHHPIHHTNKLIMRHIFLLLLSLASAPLAFADTIVLATPLGPPLSLKDQQGFIDQVAAEALNVTGHTLEVSHLPAERALINANKGIDDGDLHRIGGLSKIYPNLLQTPEKIFTMEFVAFSRNADFRTTDWNSLKLYSVGIIGGWKILEKHVPKDVELIKVKNPRQLFSLLDNNRVDVILFGKWQGLNYLKENHIQGAKELTPPLAKMDMFVYFHKKHRDLVPRFSKALRQIKSNGDYQRLYRQTLLPLIQ
jgi:polar amino acid transport system substrate-binding protein